MVAEYASSFSQLLDVHFQSTLKKNIQVYVKAEAFSNVHRHGT